MFDIGLGELLLLAVVALLVFGPEKLPKAAADAGRLLRQVRDMAAGARRDLADSAGLDLTEARDAVRDLADLHPKRLAAGLLDDVAGSEDRTDGAGRSGRRTGPAGEDRRGGSGPGPGAGAGSGAGGGSGAGSPPPPQAAFDPDAT